MEPHYATDDHIMMEYYERAPIEASMPLDDIFSQFTTIEDGQDISTLPTSSSGAYQLQEQSTSASTFTPSLPLLQMPAPSSAYVSTPETLQLTGIIPPQYPPAFNMLEVVPNYYQTQNMSSQQGTFQHTFMAPFQAPAATPGYYPVQHMQMQPNCAYHNPPQQIAPVETQVALPTSFNSLQTFEIPNNLRAQNLVALQAQPEARRPTVTSEPRRQRTRAARKVAEVQQCQLCEYKSSNNVEFRRHVDSKHNNIRRHTCDVCNVNLNDPSGLSKHKKSAKHNQTMKDLGLIPEFPGKYECPGCKENGRESRFARADQLKRHVKACKYVEGDLPDGFFDGKGGMDRGKVVEE